jgi:Abortive infection C-terminus
MPLARTATRPRPSAAPGTIVPVANPPNYLDFLVVLDDHLRKSNLGYVTYGTDLLALATDAGLAKSGDGTPVQWVGRLIHDEYVAHGPQGAGDPRPLPQGLMWSHDELSRVSDYRITPRGREEADRVRRQVREDRTDEILALTGLTLGALTDAQRRAVELPLRSLRTALDTERHAEAVGSAKDLAEAMCKLAAAVGSQEVPASASVSSLVKLAVTGRPAVGGEDVARRLGGVLDALGALRNERGSGHGRAEQEVVSGLSAALAASAACAIARFVLSTNG